MNKSWIQAWKQGAFGVGGTCVYFQRMIFQGASNESGGSVCRAIKIRSKTDHRGLMVNKELFDSRLWTIRAVIAIGRRFAWAASAGNCPRRYVSDGEEMGKGSEKKVDACSTVGKESADSTTVASRLIRPVRLVECSGGRVRERNAYCRSAEPNRAPLQPSAHAPPSYNSLISPQAYLFRTWDSPRNHVLRSQLRLNPVGLSTPLRVIHKRFDIRFSIILSNASNWFKGGKKKKKKKELNRRREDRRGKGK